MVCCHNMGHIILWHVSFSHNVKGMWRSEKRASKSVNVSGDIAELKSYLKLLHFLAWQLSLCLNQRLNKASISETNFPLYYPGMSEIIFFSETWLVNYLCLVLPAWLIAQERETNSLSHQCCSSDFVQFVLGNLFDIS